MISLAVDTLARTAYGEARGCGRVGMTGVINVVMNRVAHPRWWGNSIIEVCRAPYQFSCWNASAGADGRTMRAASDKDPWFSIAVALALRADQGDLPDLTHGADSYYARTMPYPPAWAERATFTYRDNWHDFYRVELPGPSGLPQAAPVNVHSADWFNLAEIDKLESNG